MSAKLKKKLSSSVILRIHRTEPSVQIQMKLIIMSHFDGFMLLANLTLFISGVSSVNPIALRKTKIANNFGLFGARGLNFLLSVARFEKAIHLSGSLYCLYPVSPYKH